jgi:hypothetical protein
VGERNVNSKNLEVTAIYAAFVPENELLLTGCMTGH